MSAKPVFFTSLASATLALLAIAAALPGTVARGEQALSGAFTITSSEAPGASGTLVIDRDLTIRRRLVCKDGAVREASGRGELSGATLTVTLGGTQDPRDLSGEWVAAGAEWSVASADDAVTGTATAGAWHGVATFSESSGAWAAHIDGALSDDGARTITADIAGTLDGLVFSGVEARAGSGVSPPRRWRLSPDGLELALDGEPRETFTRAGLPAGGRPRTATYTLDANGALTGRIDDGTIDCGVAQVLAPQTTSIDPAGVPLSPDPVPQTLRAIAAGKVLKSPKAGAAVVREVAEGEMVPVVGRSSGYWQVGPFPVTATSVRATLRGWLPEDALQVATHYGEVPGALFLDTPPTPESVRQRTLGTCYLDAALMSIAATDADSLRRLARENPDHTVSVRFFKKAKDGTFAEHWVRVSRELVLDAKGRASYTTGAGGQLWPAIVEKAYAVFAGDGYYRKISGGSSGRAFEAVLGRRSRSHANTVWVPAELDAKRLGKELPGMPTPDCPVIEAYRESARGKQQAQALTLHPERRRDIKYFEAEIGSMKDLSFAGWTLLMDYYRARTEGPLGSGRYSPNARAFFDDIRAALAAKKPVAVGTRHWTPAARPAAQSGVEVGKVPGLASGHEYAVLSAFEDERHLCWIHVMNPWHHLSRKYDWVGGQLKASAQDGKNDAGKGTFDVELSDAVRYFQGAYIAD